MKINLLTVFLFASLAFVSCQDSQSPHTLVGTIWYNEFYGETDSLRFFEGNLVQYYLAENSRWFPSTYIPYDDTLYLLTTRQATVIEHVEAIDPEIVQKLIFHGDTMSVIYQAIYRGKDMKVTKPKNFHFIKVQEEGWMRRLFGVEE